jgi:hypothetical protein
MTPREKDDDYINEVPSTPYTDGEENSSLGLFYAKAPDADSTEAAVPSIIVSINDTKLLKEFVERLQAHEEKAKGEDVGVGLHWKVGFNTDGPDLKDATTVNAVMVRVGLAVREIEDDAPDVILNTNAVVPINVLKAWLKPIANNECDSLSFSVLDGIMVIERSTDVSHIDTLTGSVSSAAAGPVCQFTWELDEDIISEAKEYYGSLTTKIVNDVTYDGIPYRDEIMYAMLEKRKDKEE